MSGVIAVSGVGYEARGQQILDDVSFVVSPQSFTVVVGENGAGKTTLLRLLVGVAKPTRGSVLVLDKEPQRDPWADRSRIAYLSERMSPPTHWSVGEFLEFNRFFYPSYSRELEGSLLARFRLDAQRSIGQLSAGESRRAQVVAALAALPELVIVDEITAVLDIVGRADFLDALAELRAKTGATVLMATNIIDDIDDYATHVLLMHRGRLARHATKEELAQSAGAGSLTRAIARMIREAEGRPT